jgi:hypothetical protein
MTLTCKILRYPVKTRDILLILRILNWNIHRIRLITDYFSLANCLRKLLYVSLFGISCIRKIRSTLQVENLK